jgi:VWFA-related protein
MFVVNFNEKVKSGLPGPISFTNQPDELARAISDEPATGMTALYDAVVEAQERLQTGRWEKKVLLVISDGGDNASKHNLPEVLKLAGQSSTLVYAVGLFDGEDSDRNPDVLKRLAQATGGEAYFPRRFDEVEVICEHIAHEIRHQYTLGYASNNPPRPGVFRTIQVAARSSGKSKLSVRTRSGYVAAGEAGK